MALGAVAVAFAACGETIIQVGEGDIVAMRVSPDTVAVGVGFTVDLQALPLDERGALIVGLDVEWASSDTDIATVDDTGTVTGVSAGEAEITATVAGLSATSVVNVLAPPEVVLSADTVRFSATAGGADPAPDAVDVTNGGELELMGLAVDSIVYDTQATDWLVAQLSASVAPSTLDLQPQAAGVTTAGTYVATVWLSAVDALGRPARLTVIFTVEAGAAAALSIIAGDAQSAEAGTAVAVAPSVRVADAFGNDVAGADVTFAVASGGGSVTGASVTTDEAGLAEVGSWTLGTVAGANTLTASVAGLIDVTFTATGVAGAAAALQIAAGDGQSAVAGSDVAIPPEVTAVDVHGNGVAGVSVTFSVVTGGGSITSASGVTDVDGDLAVGSWTLGTTAGENRLRAVAAAIPDSVEFVATGLTGTAERILRVARDSQTDPVAATLPTPYSVRVVDSNGNGVEGIPVSWSVTGGGGSITASSTTDADGIATNSRVLGTTVGAMTANGAVGGLIGSPVVFTATAVAGAPAILAQVTGDGQSATVDTDVTVAPEVSVTDQFGNAIEGEAVTFAVTGGGGTVAPGAAVLTDASGQASVTSWTLGQTAGTGNNTLQATTASAGVAGSPSTFTASATADAPAAITITSTASQTQITGLNVASPPTVLVEDQFGNPVPGETVDFTPSGSGSVGSGSVATNASGTATTTWTVSVTGSSVQTDGTFPNTLTAAVQGTALSTQFAADAIYSYVTHVNPVLCVGCHTGATPAAGLSLDGDAASDYDELVLEPLTCDDDGAALPASYRRVSTAGGVQAADDFSMILRYTDPALTGIGACTFTAHVDLSASALAIIRAWIRNGAPEN